MDRIILTKDQLLTLREFIGRRSERFRDPVVMLEILDHFACKVEELMAAGIAFDKAITKAHESFGVRGFAPIADHVESSISKRYKGYNRREFGKMIRSFHLIGIPAFGVLLFQLALWGKDYLLGSRFFYLMVVVELFYLANLFSTSRKERRRLKTHPIFEMAAREHNISAYFIWIPFGSPFIATDHYNITTQAIFFAVANCVFLIGVLMQRRLNQYVQTDISKIEKEYAETC